MLWGAPSFLCAFFLLLLYYTTFFSFCNYYAISYAIKKCLTALCCAQDRLLQGHIPAVITTRALRSHA